MHNPVFSRDGKWYYQLGVTVSGPFDTAEEAYASLRAQLGEE